MTAGRDGRDKSQLWRLIKGSSKTARLNESRRVRKLQGHESEQCNFSLHWLVIIFFISLTLYDHYHHIIASLSISCFILSYDIHTPLHAGRQCWGKSILPRAGYGLGTYRTVDIFNFSLISWTILEEKRFLCFYIIKSIARKGYFGPKYPKIWLQRV